MSQLVVGTDGGENSYPFGSNVSEYQQVYSANDFSGAITISALTFYLGSGIPVSNTINTGNYQIEFSTTSVAVGALSSNLASNIGANNTTVYDAVISGSDDPSFTLDLTPFTYNPSQGNLLMTIIQTDTTGPTSEAFLAAQYDSPGLFSRAFSGGGADDPNEDIGLVTGFTETAAAPEPSTWALFLGGIIGLGMLLRRRKSSGQPA